jgi:hypothetical protein
MSPWLGCIIWTLHHLGSAKSFQDGHYGQDWKRIAKLLWQFFYHSKRTQKFVELANMVETKGGH